MPMPNNANTDCTPISKLAKFKFNCIEHLGLSSCYMLSKSKEEFQEEINGFVIEIDEMESLLGYLQKEEMACEVLDYKSFSGKEEFIEDGELIEWMYWDYLGDLLANVSDEFLGMDVFNHNNGSFELIKGGD